MNNANEPAFPHKHGIEEEGLTKREYFAALALQALVSRPDLDENVKDWTVTYRHATVADAVADQAVCLADAMLRALGEQ